MNIILEKLIHDEIDWLKVLTKQGETQNSERYYISVVKKCINRLGGTIGSVAGAQQPIDIRDVTLPDGQVYSYECKKVNKGSRFMFNDTFLKPDVWYILIYSDIKKVRIENGLQLMNENIEFCEATNPKLHLKNIAELCITMLADNESLNSENVQKIFYEMLNFLKSCVVKNIISYFDFGELFKTNIKFGNFTSRPRPNWNLSFTPPEETEPTPMDIDSDPIYEEKIVAIDSDPIATEQPPPPLEVEPHYLVEQPEPLVFHTIRSLGESLELLSAHQSNTAVNNTLRMF